MYAIHALFLGAKCSSAFKAMYLKYVCSMLLFSKNKYLTKKAVANHCIPIELNWNLRLFFPEAQLTLFFGLVYSCVVKRKT